MKSALINGQKYQNEFCVDYWFQAFSSSVLRILRRTQFEWGCLLLNVYIALCRHADSHSGSTFKSDLYWRNVIVLHSLMCKVETTTKVTKECRTNILVEINRLAQVSRDCECDRREWGEIAFWTSTVRRNPLAEIYETTALNRCHSFKDWNNCCNAISCSLFIDAFGADRRFDKCAVWNMSHGSRSNRFLFFRPAFTCLIFYSSSSVQQCKNCNFMNSCEYLAHFVEKKAKHLRCEI